MSICLNDVIYNVIFTIQDWRQSPEKAKKRGTSSLCIWLSTNKYPFLLK